MEIPRPAERRRRWRKIREIPREKRASAPLVTPNDDNISDMDN
jgi:hypothetical protein